MMMIDPDTGWPSEQYTDIPTIEELAERQGVQLGQGKSWDDRRCDIWESDEELDAFLADLYASRRADVI
jgi:hypothetical protein